VSPPITAAPAASFIVIEAPDVPVAAKKTGSAPVRPAAPLPARRESQIAEKSAVASAGDSKRANEAAPVPEPEKEMLGSPSTTPIPATATVSAGDAGAGNEAEGP
jgi:hypothetical protein